MINWRTSRLMILFLLLMAGVVGMTAIANWDLTKLAAANLPDVFARLRPSGSTPAPQATPSISPAVDGLMTRAIPQATQYPVLHIPANRPNPFAP